MSVEEKQLKLISSIYDGMVSTDLWPDLLQECALDVGAASCILASTNILTPDEVSIVAYSSHFTSDVIEDYEHNYAQYDRGAWQELLFMPSGSILPDEKIWPDQSAPEIKPYMQWCEENLGINKRVGYRLNDDKSWFEAIAFQFNMPSDNMLGYDTLRSRILVPHFAKAVELMRGFNMLKSRFNAVLSALDHFHLALIMVKGDGKIVHLNTAAHRILDLKGAILKTQNGYIKFNDETIDLKAKDAIQRAAATAQAENTESQFVFKVDKRNIGNGYLVEISPLKDSGHEIDGQFRDALIMIIDADNVPPIPLAGFAEFYKLSKVETLVLELLIRGMTTEEIADKRNVTIETVKSQIKSIFAKTGENSRISLIRKVLHISIPIDRV